MGSGEMPLFCPLGGGGGTEGRTVGRVDTQVDGQRRDALVLSPGWGRGTEGRTVGRVDTQVDGQWRDALVLSPGWGEGDRGAYRGESRHAG